MDAMEVIFSRRSIRKYTSQPVPEETIKDILRAGMSAPSAGNEQPWQFIVLKDRKIINQIPEVHPYSKMVKEAPVVIVVCGDLQLEKYKGYWVQDCSAATENMLLAAQAKGLGSVWLGVYPTEERVAGVQKLLNLPKHVLPLSIIPLGYSGEQKQKEDRYKQDRVHQDKW